MSRVQRLLAFDTAGSACSAAVWVDGRVIAQQAEVLVRGHSERILPIIQAVMAEAGLSFGALDGLAVTTGPGTFTGIRIGLATARGLAMAGRLPVLGLSSFEAVAAAVAPEDALGRTLVVVLESKRTDLYVQCFKDPRTACSSALTLIPESLCAEIPPGPVLLAGDAVEQVEPALAASGRDVKVAASARRTDSAVLARLAAARSETDWQARSLQPLYLRAPDVTRPKTIRYRAMP